MVNAASQYADLDDSSRNELFEKHLPLVKIIAHHVSVGLPPGQSVDDLIQVGMMGLLEATRCYEAQKDVQFKTYASIRIRGAMLDELRKDSWMPRSVQQKSKKISRAIQSAEARLQRTASDKDIAKELRVSIEEYYRMLDAVAGCTVFSIEDNPGQHEHHTDDQSPELDIECESTRQKLAEVMEGLPRQEKLVLFLYYNKGLNMQEVSKVLEVSESRICQVHSQAVNRIRGRLTREVEQTDL
ncbi:MAG: RNA polymerase sigma factor FliA [Gammaproteobacteria bacterium]